MGLIKVHSFTVYDPKNARDKIARGMAPIADIQKIEGAKVIDSDSAIVEETELTQSRRYYRPVARK